MKNLIFFYNFQKKLGLSLLFFSTGTFYFQNLRGMKELRPLKKLIFSSKTKKDNL